MAKSNEDLLLFDCEKNRWRRENSRKSPIIFLIKPNFDGGYAARLACFVFLWDGMQNQNFRASKMSMLKKRGGKGGGGDDDDSDASTPPQSPVRRRGGGGTEPETNSRKLVATTVTRKARPLSPSRLNHLITTIEKSQYKMKNKDELIQQKIEELFVKKRIQLLHSRIKQKAGMSEAIKYAIQGDLLGLKRELKLGYDINERSKVTGRAAIHEAAGAGHHSLVKMMCYDYRSVLDLNRQTVMGHSTALHLAVGGDYRPIVAILLTMGADVNQVDKQGNSPLFLVKSLPMCKLLFKTNIDAFIRNKHGQTARDYYLEVTPLESQIRDIIDIMRERELARAIELTRQKKADEEAFRQRELDRLALVNQDESHASWIGRNNPANLRVKVVYGKGKKKRSGFGQYNYDDDEEEESEAAKAKRLAREEAELKEKERKEKEKIDKERQERIERESKMTPLQQKAALLERLTKHTRKAKAEKEGVAMIDDGTEGGDVDSHNGKSTINTEVSAGALKRQLLRPPMKDVIIDDKFELGKKYRSTNSSKR